MSSKQDSNPGDCRRLTVLIVENETLIRLGAAELLRDCGHEVREARNAAEAIAELDAGRTFDIVISDVRTSGPVDGIRLMEMLRDRFPATGRLLATAHWPEGGVPGACHLAKPYSGDMLRNAVAEAVRAIGQ